ncbi:cation diffusion facilitator family transporter [Actinomadura xylanilytica]|uniref:cation diffusion facilitator family transporter n=1 Tax=Actinomadura xylanilytica TaxID=887459 RepID=UPI00255B1135|nr:cation diffusion facilitator family transporter [Actinomadura xylanilytica]MDL4776740.1 cation diffusion facilitator family transporter [Actinomadura xylanilytica]
MSDQSTSREPHHHDRRPGGHRHDGHEHGPGRWSRFGHQVAHLARPHGHEAADKVDPAMETSAEGMRTLWISLGVLAVTAVLQAGVVVLSGSVALLGDTVHNAADALTALPLGVAFVLGRRAATRRFTYGFGRAEDLAGIVIVLTIAASSALAAWTAVDRLLNPRTIGYLPAVAAAAVIGFIGNEWVARYRIATGRRIGSAALVADGLHARTDGFTSLAVLLGAGGAALGWPLADPIVGLLITIAILAVLKDAVREVFRRLMDAVDPALIDRAEHVLRAVDGVVEVGELRMRWIGHRLRAEIAIVVAGDLSVRDAHRIAVEAEHALLHAVPRLAAALVHADPATRHGDTDPHAPLARHRAPA